MHANEATRAIRPFVDFYRANEISPVGQDLSDFERHLQRRESLYRSLGIPPAAIRGRRVLEFCPGSGYNALYTASLAPQRYLLVDANRTGLNRARQLFAEHYPNSTGCEFIESLVEFFVSDERFELVLCEGAIPHQLDPPAFARRIATFAASGGVLVVTTIDPASYLSEIVRRLIAARLSDPRHPVEQRLEELRSLFTVDLQTLRFRSRPVDDWILDNIIQPFDGSRYFSVADAIEALAGEGFDVYGSSPAFLHDWRWYKELVGQHRSFNEVAIAQYQRNILTMLDHRFVRAEHDATLGRDVLAASERIWQCALAADRGDAGALARGIDEIKKTALLIEPLAPETARSLLAAARYLRAANTDVSELEEFRGWFGRGQQYVSFIRNGSDPSIDG